MAKLPAFDPIEFLLDRKFGKPGAFAGRPITISAERRRSEEPELAEEIDSHEAYLRKLSPENLSRLVAAEQKKQVQERAAEAEAEERARFFNQPYARADFVHWSKTAHWSSARSLFRLDLAGYCPNKADELTGDRRDDDGRLLLACQHPTVSSAQPHLRLPGNVTNHGWQRLLALVHRLPDFRRHSIRPGGFHDQSSSDGAARLGDAGEATRLTARALARNQTEVRHELTRIVEPPHVTDLGDHAGRDHARCTAGQRT
jgi:hypothetical protein